MTKKNLLSPTEENIILFNDEKIRRERYDDERYFSVVDIVNILSDSKWKDKWAYWRKLKQRLIGEWSEVVTNCHELKMIASDGKRYRTDAANTKTILRIIQSIPSPNAEPFKQRLASLWNERVEESNDPELWIARARTRASTISRTTKSSYLAITNLFTHFFWEIAKLPITPFSLHHPQVSSLVVLRGFCMVSKRRPSLPHPVTNCLFTVVGFTPVAG